MSINKYVGSRYVPIYIGVHDKNIDYEPLSIVSNTEKTETYTSKQHVPIGVSLDDETYWVQSGFSNADLQIDVDNAGYLSTDQSELEIEKTNKGYLITLNASNSFDCGGEFGEAYTLNTLYDVGRYMIKPSECTGVPSEIASIDNPAELIIAEYTNLDESEFRFYQKITAFDNDNAASFIRIHDGSNWSDWKMIGGAGGGSYVLPVATSSVLGGVKIGSGVNVSNDGTISVTTSSISGWEDYSSFTIQNEYFDSSKSFVQVNKSAGLARIHLEINRNKVSTLEVGYHSMNAESGCVNLPKPLTGSAQENAFYGTSNSVSISGGFINLQYRILSTGEMQMYGVYVVAKSGNFVLPIDIVYQIQ